MTRSTLIVLCIAWVISLITLQSVISLLGDTERLLLFKKTDPTPNYELVRRLEGEVQTLQAQETGNKWVSYFILPIAILALGTLVFRQHRMGRIAEGFGRKHD